MAPKTPANRLFFAAQAGVLLILALLIADLLFNRQSELAASQDKIQRFNAMLAEHTARTFDAVDILLREISGDLNRSQNAWSKWNENDGWNYLAQRHSRSMPQLRSLAIYNIDGLLQHRSTPLNGPRDDISRKKYFDDVMQGKKLSRAGPFFEVSSGQHTYSLGHRLSDSQGNFAGLLQATVDPMYLQEFCWPNRLTEDFEAVLTNSNGEIIASCRPSDQGRQSTLIGRHSEEVLFNGQLRGLLPASGSVHVNGFVIALTTVPGFPELRLLTVAPSDSLLIAWNNRLLELGVLALLIVGIMSSSALLARRQLQRLSAISAELAASHADLEQRIATATAQAAQQRDNAELANVGKSRFLAAASHDLRQPMHALSLFATDLQAQARTSTYRDLPRLAEHIGASTRQLSELLDALLDISRIDLAGITPAIRNFPLQALFERLQGTHLPTAKAKQQTLRIRRTPLWLTCDPALLERMLGNLISNALRYTPPNGRILLAARQRGEQVLIEVRDNGIGISPENQAAVFVEFYQVANPAREYHQGLGLGLSIVERLAKALDIPIGLYSAANQGTLFTLTVPGCPALTTKKIPVNAQTTAICLALLGNSVDLEAAGKLAGNWGYQVIRLNPDKMTPPPALPEQTIILAELPQATQAHNDWPRWPVLTLLPAGSSKTQLPQGLRACPLPLRPGSLRALLEQVQRTLSRSIP